MENLRIHLIERIENDPAFPLTRQEIESELEPSMYIGRSISQTDEFIENYAKPVIDRLFDGNDKAELLV